MASLGKMFQRICFLFFLWVGITPAPGQIFLPSSCAGQIRETYAGNIPRELRPEVRNVLVRLLNRPSSSDLWGAPTAALLQTLGMPREQLRAVARPVLERTFAAIRQKHSELGFPGDLKLALDVVRYPPVVRDPVLPPLYEKPNRLHKKWDLRTVTGIRRAVAPTTSPDKQATLALTNQIVQTLDLAVYTGHRDLAETLLALLIQMGKYQVAAECALTLGSPRVAYALILYRARLFLSEPLTENHPINIFGIVGSIKDSRLRRLAQAFLVDFAWAVSRPQTLSSVEARFPREDPDKVRANLILWATVALSCSGEPAGYAYTEETYVEPRYRLTDPRLRPLAFHLISWIEGSGSGELKLTRAAIPLLDFLGNRVRTLRLARRIKLNSDNPDDRLLADVLLKARLFYRTGLKLQARKLIEDTLMSFYSDATCVFDRVRLALAMFAEAKDYEGLDRLEQFVHARMHAVLARVGPSGAPLDEHETLAFANWGSLNDSIHIVGARFSSDSYLRFFYPDLPYRKPAMPWVTQEDRWESFFRSSRWMRPGLIESALRRISGLAALRRGDLTEARGALLLRRQPEDLLALARASAARNDVLSLTEAIDYYTLLSQMALPLADSDGS